MFKKKCTKCNQELPCVSFFRDRTKKNGFYSSCKKCVSVHLIKNEENLRASKKKSREKSKRNGKCVNCSKKSLEHSFFCEEHWYKEKSRCYLGSIKYWEKLKVIFINQNEECVYSGECLILGLNTSFDHIIPKSKILKTKPEVSNVQWLTKDMNRIKNSLLHEQFLNLCLKVCLYNNLK